MFNIRFIVIFAGSLLAGLGLMIGLAAGGNMISDARNDRSPFDQIDNVPEPDKGFIPMIVPTLEPVGSLLAPNVVSRSTFFPAPTGKPLATPGPVLTATAAPIRIPDRIVVPAIQLDAPVVPAKTRIIAYQGMTYSQWMAPDAFAAGWDTTSASLGLSSNIVFFGHHNVDGEVFRHLVDLQVGDLIVVYSGEEKFTYVVALKMILKERNEPVAIRLRNAEWILPSADERLTLITCWPYTSNTHRLVIVATRVSVGDLKDYPLIPRLTLTP